MIGNVKESTISWDMVEPCAHCPFLKSTPPERKGICDSLPEIMTALAPGGDGQIAHSCHVTDPRVTDGGYNPAYQGSVQHCAGMLLMMAKSDLWSGAALRAMANGKLDPRTLKSTNKVHTLKELIKVMLAWAKKTLAEDAAHD